MDRVIKVVGTTIHGVRVLEPEFHEDERGYFGRVFDAGWDDVESFQVKQVNRSYSRESQTLRGMHYQDSVAQEAKIVTCLSGSIFDVIVDLRRGSETFLAWCGVFLDSRDRASVLVPRGCAHGFLTCEPGTELLYLHDNFHDPAAERGIHFADARLSIDWPATPTVLSRRDAGFPRLSDDFRGIAS